MSIQRIESKASHTRGWQARAYVPGQPDILIPAFVRHHPGPTPDLAPMATGTEARVCADIARRQQLGLKKYGTSVGDNPLPLRAWLQHAYEEHLDAATYLRRAIEQLDRDAAARAP